MVFFEVEAKDSQQMPIDTVQLRAIVHRLHSPRRKYLDVEVESTVHEKTEVCDLSCIVELSVELPFTEGTYEQFRYAQDEIIELKFSLPHAGRVGLRKYNC